MVNPNMENYKIAGTLDIPEIEVVIDNMPERGVIGLGEPPVIPPAGALANAVYNAIGVRMRSLPITPDRVLEALAKKGGA
jgi:xanthine dehydrogenase YagR molybdenum-binding subunit